VLILVESGVHCTYRVLCCPKKYGIFQEPVLLLEVSGVQGTELLLDVSVLLEPVLTKDVPDRHGFVLLKDMAGL